MWGSEVQRECVEAGRERADCDFPTWGAGELCFVKVGPPILWEER